MQHTLDNKVVFITGSSQRVGAATARLLHERGWRVIIHYRHSELAAHALVDTLNQVRPTSAAALHADLDAVHLFSQLAEQAYAIFGRIDALVNNASTFYATPIAEANIQQWDDLFSSNARAPFFLSQALRPYLQQQDGCIVNIVDIHAERPFRDYSIYCMAKAALQMMTYALAKELAPFIRVNGVAPGAILWPAADTVSAINESQQQEILSSVPLARSGSPSDIARTVAFLLDDAPYITGQIIAVDGGRRHTLGKE
ncbi:pteridine reductase [Agitococcus lubricus]|uniref:Pteridine reductase n=1 Tax=Agitococcus lubricus TaxID=1077255 RepID=A0A2T5IYH9_9GAMM|nr:pteridine reductase [Agitococcus lubricus]PTQ89025.1 pteridine reductase [Agitococcus lubricus]